MNKDDLKRSAAEAAVAEHYGLLLGIGSPWKVRKADLNILERKVEIVIEHDA